VRITFCLWPQTVGGHRTGAQRRPCRREIFGSRKAVSASGRSFSSTTTTVHRRPSARRGDRSLGSASSAEWSCNPMPTASSDPGGARDNGYGVLLVGYESGNHSPHTIKRGCDRHRPPLYQDCRSSAITIPEPSSSAFPGETRNRSRRRSALPAEINPHTIQVSLPLPIPARTCSPKRREWLARSRSCRADLERGVRIAPLQYTHLSHTESSSRSKPSTSAFYVAVRNRLARRREVTAREERRTLARRDFSFVRWGG